MLAIALALCASVVWGVSDFLGGTLVRRLPLAGVLVSSQAISFAALLAVSALAGSLDLTGLSFGLVAGAFSAVSLAGFYRALALGTMSVASPLLSSGAVLAFGIAVAAGERPSRLALAGALVAAPGIVLSSLDEHASGGARRDAVTLSLFAAVALAGFLYLFGRGSDEGGAVSALLGSRAGSLALLGAGALVIRPAFHFEARDLGAVSALGLLTVAAGLLLGLASERGLISITSVLASLYPIVTVLLAHLLLGERLTAVQRIGVPLAVVGVALVTLG